VEVNRASDIRNVLALARDEKVRVILSGGSEAWMVAAEIAAAKVPVIIDAEENQAFQWENLNATYEHAAILQRSTRVHRHRTICSLRDHADATVNPRHVRSRDLVLERRRDQNVDVLFNPRGSWKQLVPQVQRSILVDAAKPIRHSH
jgi:hypothetical protein